MASQNDQSNLTESANVYREGGLSSVIGKAGTASSASRGDAPLTNADILQALSEMVNSKIDWLDTFSDGRQKRPDHEIEYARRHLAVLTGLRDAYARKVAA